MEIIAAIGAASTQGLQTHAFDADFRLKSLDAPETGRRGPAPQGARAGQGVGRQPGPAGRSLARARPSSPTTTTTRPASAPACSYDTYGNMYYSNYDPFSPEMMARQRGMPMAVKVADVVKNAPGDAWLAFVDEGIKPKFATVFAKLYLKVNEEDEAFPYIEQLVAHQPPQGQGAGRGVRPRLDQEPRPQLAAVAAQPVLLRLRVREPGRGHPADPLEAGAQPASSWPAGSRGCARCRSASSTRSC